MSTMINNRICYATVGNMSRSGTLVTLRFMSSKTNAPLIFGSFVDGQYTATVGLVAARYDSFAVNGWFQRDRSGFQMREVYAEITLVFDTQNVQGLVPTSDSQVRYDPVYSIGISMDERPIEQNPRFRCFWAYNLYELVPLGGSASAIPAWAATDTNPNAIHAGYLWSRTPPPSPDPAKEYIQVQAATKPGKDSYLIPRPSVTSVIYYKTRNIGSSDIINGGKLKAPPETFIYPNTQSCWLCQPSGVAEASDDLMAVTTTYVYAAEGWDTEIYELAT